MARLCSRKLFAVASRWIRGLAAAGGRNGRAPRVLLARRFEKLPSRNQITHLACEEGWSFIAEWTGVPLSVLLDAAATLPEAKFVVSYSIEKRLVGQHRYGRCAASADARDLRNEWRRSAGGHGGPLRLRVPRQLGYKSLKYLTRLTVTDDLKKLGRELSDPSPGIRLVRRDLRRWRGTVAECIGVLRQRDSPYTPGGGTHQSRTSSSSLSRIHGLPVSLSRRQSGRFPTYAISRVLQAESDLRGDRSDTRVMF